MKVLTLKDFKYLIDNLFKNKTSLDKISESEEGVLLFNEEEISGGSGGGSEINDLFVSDNNTYSSEKIEERLTEIINAIGTGGGSGTSAVLQKAFLNVTNNSILYISTVDKNTADKSIVQLYKIIEGDSNIVEVLKTFDNSDKDNFYYNKDGVEFDGVMKIKDKYELSKSLNTDGLYETDVIDKEQFVDLYGIEVI